MPALPPKQGCYRIDHSVIGFQKQLEQRSVPFCVGDKKFLIQAVSEIHQDRMFMTN